MALDANIMSVEPTGVGHVLIALAIFFLILTSIIVALRCVIRLKHRMFGIDDGLMLFGWVGFTPSSFVIWLSQGLTSVDPRCFMLLSAPSRYDASILVLGLKIRT
jgi:hypothetical protein